MYTSRSSVRVTKNEYGQIHSLGTTNDCEDVNRPAKRVLRIIRPIMAASLADALEITPDQLIAHLNAFPTPRTIIDDRIVERIVSEYGYQPSFLGTNRGTRVPHFEANGPIGKSQDRKVAEVRERQRI